METIKLPKEKIVRTLFDKNYSNVSLDLSLKIKDLKNKNKQIKPIELKNILHLKTLQSKENHYQMKIKPTMWEKIFAKCMTNKVLLFSIYIYIYVCVCVCVYIHTHRQLILYNAF